MENNNWEKEFRTHFLLPEVEALVDFIRETRLSAFQEGLEESLKLLPEENDFFGGKEHPTVTWNQAMQAAGLAITSRIEESKKGK